MDNNPNSHKSEDRLSAKACTRMAERGKDIAAQAAVLRLQARLWKIHCLLGTEMKTKPLPVSREHVWL
jgi:hypothetical protein